MWPLADACAKWHTDEATALAWVANGSVQATTGPDGETLIPLAEVARWQGVLGQNRLLPNVDGSVSEDDALAATIRERLAQPVITWEEALAAVGVSQEDVDAVNIADYAIEPMPLDQAQRMRGSGWED